MQKPDPYSPPASARSEERPSVSGLGRAMGMLCIGLSLFLLLPGVVQLLNAAMVLLAALNSSRGDFTAQAIGGVVGSVVLLTLGGWLFKFGQSKLRPEGSRR